RTRRAHPPRAGTARRHRARRPQEAGTGRPGIAIRRAAFIALGFASIACYQMNVTRLRVRTPFSDEGCVQMADAVFNREGFAAVPRITGVNRLYTPRASTATSIPLRWGIAVTIEGGPDSDTRGQCIFELEPVGTDID